MRRGNVKRPMAPYRDRPRRTWLTAAALVSSVAAALMAMSGPASASCAAPLATADALGHADVVVVGTVVATRSRDRIATIRVEEIWKGHPASPFEVFGGPASDSSATSVDRVYTPGARYLLFVREPAAHGETSTFDGRYEDNQCSATQMWNDALARYRPADAVVVGPSSTTLPGARPQAGRGHPSGGGDKGRLVASVATVVVAGLAVSAVLRARGRRRERSA